MNESKPGAGGPARRSPRRPSSTPLEGRDPLGRMALFSEIEPEEPQRRSPARGLVVECSACLARTPVSPLDLVRAALPLSIHVPLLRAYDSFMRCPACGRRVWVRVRLRG